MLFSTFARPMNLEYDKDLSVLNTFKIKACSDIYIPVYNLTDLLEACSYARKQQSPILIMGGGSNMLFVNNFKGIIIHNCLRGKSEINRVDDFVFVEVAAGETWDSVVKWAAENDWGGIENLAMIPGSCGAAPVQNIGAYGVELKDVLHSVTVINIQTGQSVTLNNKECELGYRDSIFKNKFKNKYIIVSLTLKLTHKNHIYKTSYGDIQRYLNSDYAGIETVVNIGNTVRSIRSAKLPNPDVEGNAGSFFKNPEVPISFYQSILKQFPEMPGYPVTDRPGYIKIPAGWLIEKTGWKGKVLGNVGCHDKQALVIVNLGNATGIEVYNLSNKIMASVLQLFGIELKPEVNIIL